MGVKSWEKTMCFAWGIARFDVAVQGDVPSVVKTLRSFLLLG